MMRVMHHVPIIIVAKVMTHTCQSNASKNDQMDDGSGLELNTIIFRPFLQKHRPCWT